MKETESKTCPKCKKKLYRNGTRNGNQRWRCSGKNCTYTYTENLKTPNIKTNAVSFFYDVMRELLKHKAKLDNEIIQTTIQKTKYKSGKKPIITINDVKPDITINANSFILQITGDNLELLSLRYFDKNLLFKRDIGKFNITEYKETKKTKTDHNDYLDDDYPPRYY